MSDKQLYRVVKPINHKGEYVRKGTEVSLTEDEALQVIDRVEAVIQAPAAVEVAAPGVQDAPQAPEVSVNDVPAEAPAAPSDAPQAPEASAQGGDMKPPQEDLNDL